MTYEGMRKGFWKHQSFLDCVLYVYRVKSFMDERGIEITGAMHLERYGVPMEPERDYIIKVKHLKNWEYLGPTLNRDPIK